MLVDLVVAFPRFLQLCYNLGPMGLVEIDLILLHLVCRVLRIAVEKVVFWGGGGMSFRMMHEMFMSCKARECAYYYLPNDHFIRARLEVVIRTHRLDSGPPLCCSQNPSLQNVLNARC